MGGVLTTSSEYFNGVGDFVIRIGSALSKFGDLIRILRSIVELFDSPAKVPHEISKIVTDIEKNYRKKEG